MILMNSKQTTVMWLGLLLVLLRFFTSGQWKAVWATILKGQKSSGGIGDVPPIVPPPPNPIPDPPLPEIPLPELPPVVLG